MQQLVQGMLLPVLLMQLEVQHAATSARNAATSATNAAGSATNAATSARNASPSATNAAEQMQQLVQGMLLPVLLMQLNKCNK